MRFFFLPMALAVLLAGVCSGQGAAASVAGRVLDPDGAPVSKAAVRLFARDGSAQQATATGPDGSFRLAAPPGEYLIEARAPGLASSAPRPVSLASAGTLELDLTLELEQVATRVVVTAAGLAQSTDELAKAFDVISAEELDNRAEFSFAEALRLTPGMRIQQLGGPGAFTNLFTRGLRAFDTSILIDGFRLRDAASTQGDATAFLGDLQVLDADRIEVLRGSGSSLYGTHAMAGVANIVSSRGGGPTRGSLAFEGGGLGLARGVARMAGGGLGGRLGYSAGVTHLNIRSGVDGNDPVRNSSLQGSASYQVSSGGLLTGRLFVTDAWVAQNSIPSMALGASLPPTGFVPARPLDPAGIRLAEQGLPYEPGSATFVPSLDDPDSSRAGRFVSTLLGYTQRLGYAGSLRLNYQGLVTRRDHRNGPGGVGFQPLFNSSDRFDGRIDVLQARSDWQLGRFHLLTGGYEFEREHYESLSRDENPAPAARLHARAQVTQRSHAGFLHDQMRWLDGRLQLSLSGRFQRFRLSRPSFEGGAAPYATVPIPRPPDAYTGDAALAWMIPSTSTKLRAHAGNSYRAPTGYERFGTFFFSGFFSVYGDPRLSPERALAFDGGFDQYLAGSRVKLSGTYFYTRLQQVMEFDFSGAIDPVTDPFGRFAGYRNTGGGLARGLELSAEANPTRRLVFRSSYTYTNADQRQSSLVGGSLRTIRIPDHMVTLTATQALTRNLDLTFDLFASSSYLYPFFDGTGSRPFVFEGPRKADLALTYRVPLSDTRTLEFYTRIDNMFNHRYFEDGFRTPRAWAVGGMRFLF